MAGPNRFHPDCTVFVTTRTSYRKSEFTPVSHFGMLHSYHPALHWRPGFLSPNAWALVPSWNRRSARCRCGVRQVNIMLLMPEQHWVASGFAASVALPDGPKSQPGLQPNGCPPRLPSRGIAPCPTTIDQNAPQGEQIFGRPLNRLEGKRAYENTGENIRLVLKGHFRSLPVTSGWPYSQPRRWSRPLSVTW